MQEYDSGNFETLIYTMGFQAAKDVHRKWKEMKEYLSVVFKI